MILIREPQGFFFVASLFSRLSATSHKGLFNYMEKWYSCCMRFCLELLQCGQTAWKGESGMNYSFLLVHGLGGSGPQHWQTWLYGQLKGLGLDVHYPTFSNYDRPDKEVWLKELAEALKEIPSENELTVLTHSCGCSLWLHYAAGPILRKADRVILVAPPSPFLDLPEAATFYPLPLVQENLPRAASESMFVLSLDDPFCSIDDITHYLRLGAPSVAFPNMGHINTASGHGPWPWILEKCIERCKK
jgi:predicted alpha/beta hydrolase family esterase